MSDIFISFEKSDLRHAELLAQRFGGRGWTSFWDRRIPAGSTWRTTIGVELNGARCVVVLWSKASMESTWVHEEADEARRRRVLVPVLLENITPPLGFRSFQAANLADWDGEEGARPFQKLVDDIAGLIGPGRKFPKMQNEPPAEVQPPRPGWGATSRIGEESFRVKSIQPVQYRNIFISCSDQSKSVADKLEKDLVREIGSDRVLSHLPSGAVMHEIKDGDIWLIIIRTMQKEGYYSWPDEQLRVISAARDRKLRPIAILTYTVDVPSEDKLPGILRNSARFYVNCETTQSERMDQDIAKVIERLRPHLVEPPA